MLSPNLTAFRPHVIASAELVDRLDVAVLSPRDAEKRGSQVTIQVPDAAGVARRLGDAGVIPDVRNPDLLRLGVSPLSMSLTEVHDGWAALADVLPTFRS